MLLKSATIILMLVKNSLVSSNCPKDCASYLLVLHACVFIGKSNESE